MIAGIFFCLLAAAVAFLAAPFTMACLRAGAKPFVHFINIKACLLDIWLYQRTVKVRCYYYSGSAKRDIDSTLALLFVICATIVATLAFLITIATEIVLAPFIRAVQLAQGHAIGHEEEREKMKNEKTKLVLTIKNLKSQVSRWRDACETAEEKLRMTKEKPDKSDHEIYSQGVTIDCADKYERKPEKELENARKEIQALRIAHAAEIAEIKNETPTASPTQATLDKINGLEFKVFQTKLDIEAAEMKARELRAKAKELQVESGQLVERVVWAEKISRKLPETVTAMRKYKAMYDQYRSWYEAACAFNAGVSEQSDRIKKGAKTLNDKATERVRKAAADVREAMEKAREAEIEAGIAQGKLDGVQARLDSLEVEISEIVEEFEDGGDE